MDRPTKTYERVLHAGKYSNDQWSKMSTTEKAKATKAYNKLLKDKELESAQKSSTSPSEENSTVTNVLAPAIPSTSTAYVEPVLPPSDLTIQTAPNQPTASNSNSLTTLVSNKIIYSGNNPVVHALSKATNEFTSLLSMLSQTVNRVSTIGSAAENVEIAKVMKEVVRSEAVTTVMKTVSDHAACTKEEEEVTSTAGITYKLTFKLKDFSADHEVPNAIEELFNATDGAGVEVEIYDCYTSAIGEVVTFREKESFDNAKTILSSHRVNDSRPFVNVFEIKEAVISAFAIKTDGFEKEQLFSAQVLTRNDSSLSLDLGKLKTLLQRRNIKRFRNGGIENIEVYGLNSPGAATISMKIHVNQSVFRDFLATPAPRLTINNKSVRVFEEIPVTQCLKCCRFKHTSRDCEYESRCRFCGENDDIINNPFGHRTKDCPNRSLPNCPNCIEKAVAEDKILPVPPHHAATNFSCPLLKKEVNALRKTAKAEAMVPINRLFNH